jgi:hypothetical protein
MVALVALVRIASHYSPIGFHRGDTPLPTAILLFCLLFLNSRTPYALERLLSAEVALWLEDGNNNSGSQ